MRSLRWEAEAFRQFQDALTHIASQNVTAAEALAATTEKRLGSALRHPEIGRIGRVEGSRELIVHPNYLVIYAVRETTIDVVRFLHTRQQYP